VPRILRQPCLVSIGYEGRNLDDLVSQLVVNAVDVLVDVRLNPISRKPGLSKRRLAEALEQVGIQYVHRRELGNPKNNRDAFRAGSDAAVQRFWEILKTAGGEAALTQVENDLACQVVALLCFERDHGTCHRGIVVEAIRKDLPALQLVTV